MIVMGKRIIQYGSELITPALQCQQFKAQETDGSLKMEGGMWQGVREGL